MAVSNTTTRPTSSTTQTSSTRSEPQRHTVRQGENLWSIAKQRSGGRTNEEVARYHQDLIKANPQLKDPNLIRPGQELNLPDTGTTGTSGTGGSRTSRLKPATTGSSATSTYESSSAAPPPQTARPDPTASANHPPVSQDLADEVTARRTAANTNPGVRRGRAAPPPAEEEEATTQANGQPSAEKKPEEGNLDLQRRNLPHANIRGQHIHRQMVEGTDVRSGTYRSHDESAHTQNGRDLSSTERRGRTNEVAADGTFTHQSQDDTTVRDRRTGEQLRETRTEAYSVQDGEVQRGTRNVDSESGPDGKSRMQRLMELNGPEPVNATADIYSRQIAGDNDWHGAYVNDDNAHTEDRTGAGYETHAAAYRANATAGVQADLAAGELSAGVSGRVQADLVGASVSGQYGTRDSVAGALHGQAEAHIGARAEGEASIAISPNNVGLRVGGEAFAGAEVKGTVGYENRYGGVSVTGRAQAGAGAAGALDVGYRDGVIGAHVDVGAALGVGGRVTFDVNVNVGAIAEDAGKAISSAADTVQDVAEEAVENVREVATEAVENVREAATEVVENVSEAVDTARDFAESAVDTVQDVASNAGRRISNAASSVRDGAASLWNSIWD